MRQAARERADAQIVRWLQRAAWYDLRATAYLRQARDLQSGTSCCARSRALLARAHMVVCQARQLLQRAQQKAESAELLVLLVDYEAQLAGIQERTEQLIHDADEQALGDRDPAGQVLTRGSA